MPSCSFISNSEKAKSVFQVLFIALSFVVESEREARLNASANDSYDEIAEKCERNFCFCAASDCRTEKSGL